jgi:hypothetical protein
MSMMKSVVTGLSLALMTLLLCSCPEKGPTGPPAELQAQIQAAETAFNSLSSLGPSEQDAVRYHQYLNEACQLREAGDYDASMEKAKRAHLEALRLHGLLLYNQLMKTNPNPSVTFN